MEKKKVLLTCSEMLPPETVRWLESVSDLKTLGCALAEEELAKALEDAEVIVLGGEELYTLNALKSAKPGLRVVFIGVQGDTSFSPEALEYLGRDNLFVTGGGLKEVARMTVEEISNPLLRKTLIAQGTKNFRWVSLQELVGEFRPLSELDVSVIGAGGIGIQVLRLLEGKCRRLVYHDPMGERKDLTSPAILWEPDLGKAFQADFVALHLRLGEATKEVVKYQHLRQIKKGGWFLNPSRAGLVEAEGFLQYLKDGGKAIWDVFWKGGREFEEIAGQDDVFAKIARSPSFFFTSHTAAMSLETIREYGQGLKRVMEENIL